MSSLNKACILGNVGKEPEVRTTNGGSKVATLSVATSRKWTDGKGEKQEKTEWHRLVVWNRGKSGLADVVERYVNKGAKLYVEGAIEYRQYEKDGQTRYITEINVSELVLLGGDKKAESKPEAGQEYEDDFEMPF
jgi:single-strand DNA-binding protein